jgi:hypothetical protein
MLIRKRNLIEALSALALLVAVPGWALADAIYSLQLRPTVYAPCASGQVEWGYETILGHNPHAHTLFSVAVQNVYSTDLVELRINGVPFDQLISLTDGQGELSLDTDQGNSPPWLNCGDLVEIYDAIDRVTLFVVGDRRFVGARFRPVGRRPMDSKRPGGPLRPPRAFPCSW